MVRRARHCQHIADVSLQANTAHAIAPLYAAFHVCTIYTLQTAWTVRQCLLTVLGYGLLLQEFCELFAEPELFISFHRACHGNERVSCSGWTVGGDGAWHRDAAFLMPYQAPAWLKKAVGAHMCSACLRACIAAAGAKLRAQCPPCAAGTSLAFVPVSREPVRSCGLSVPLAPPGPRLLSCLYLESRCKAASSGPLFCRRDLGRVRQGPPHRALWRGGGGRTGGPRPGSHVRGRGGLQQAAGAARRGAGRG